MFSEDYRRGVCLDDQDVGLDWNALIYAWGYDASLDTLGGGGGLCN